MCRRERWWKWCDAISGISRVAGQAARSIALTLILLRLRLSNPLGWTVFEGVYRKLSQFPTKYAVYDFGIPKSLSTSIVASGKSRRKSPLVSTVVSSTI